MCAPEPRHRGSVAVRPMSPEDREAFSLFASQVPEGERRFLKEDLEDVEEIASAPTRDRGGQRARRLVAAEETGGIVGVAGAFPGTGWSAHVAEIRVLVSAAHRRRGLGRELARAAVVEALELGCSQAYVEVIAEQEALVAMFQDLGFEPAALLPDFVRDGTGEFHDLMLLTLRADDQWRLNQVLGLDEVLS
jgi:L-amino acid N-acyltransferase YncA